MDALAAEEEVQHSAEAKAEETENLRIRRKGDDPDRRRGADVRTDDHVDRLLERHQPGGDEPDQHYGDDGGGLDQNGRNDAGADTRHAVRRGERHEPPELPSRDRLKTFGKMLHAQQEHTKAAKHRHENEQNISHRCAVLYQIPWFRTAAPSFPKSAASRSGCGGCIKAGAEPSCGRYPA